jgi:hypothetical protein
MRMGEVSTKGVRANLTTIVGGDPNRPHPKPQAHHTVRAAFPLLFADSFVSFLY